MERKIFQRIWNALILLKRVAKQATHSQQKKKKKRKKTRSPSVGSCGTPHRT